MVVRIDLSSPEMESFSRGGIVAGGLARRPKIFLPPASIFGFGGAQEGSFSAALENGFSRK